MSFFGETDSISNEIKKLHREIDTLRNKSEFQPILTTGRSDDGYGAGVGSKTMNSGGVWALTPVVHSVNKLTSGATTYDMIELASACITVDRNTAQSTSITQFDVKTIRMGSTNETGATITNSAPNGAILFIKPIRGKQITLKTGGNIYISQDITLDDKAFAILQFYVDATGTGASESNKKWVMLTGSGGSGSINSIKEPCRVASTGNNGTHPVWGTTIDEVTLIEGQRFLVKNQSTARDNGIYVHSGNGLIASTRATDFDNDSEVKSGTLVTVNEGTTNGNKVYMMTEDTNPIIVGTTNIYFTLVTAVDTSADFVWTGQHKFQGDPTGNIGDSNATHTVEFGNTGSDRVRFIGEITGVGDAVITDPDGSGTYTIPNSDPSINMKASVVMNTYTMYDLDTLVFSQAESTQTPAPLNNWVWIEADTGTGSSPVLTGMKYNVPSGKTHQFAVNGTNVVTIDSTGIVGGTGVQLDDDPTWTGKHVWDNADTWSNDYDTNAEKDLHCHVKFHGDGDEHTNHDQYARQRVLTIGKYGTHEVKFNAEVVGAVDEDLNPDAFMITDPAYSGTDPASNTYAIPSSSPAISFKSNLVMNTYNIYDLDQLVFGQSTSTLSPAWENDHLGFEVARDSSGYTHGIGYNVSYGMEHTFKVGYGTAGSQNQSNDAVVIGASGNSSGSGCFLRMVNQGSAITLHNNSFIHAYNSAEIGFHVTQNTTVGSMGTMEIPYLVDTTAYSEANTTALNTAYGDDNGSIGVQHDTDGSDVLWFRANSVWRKASGGSGGSADNLGNHTATQSLNMDGEDIIGLDDITFSSGATITSDSTKLEFQVPTGDYWMFKIGAGNKFYISEILFRIYTELDMNYQKIIKVGTPLASSGTFAYDVPNMQSLTGVSPAYTIHTSHLGTGTANNTKYLRGDGTWQTYSSGGSTSFSGFTADADLAMNTFDITGLDALKFSTASNSGNVVANSEWGIEVLGAPSSPTAMRFNVPNTAIYVFHENGSVQASIDSGVFSGSGVIIGNSTTGLLINNSSGNPTVNGQFRTNGTDVKVYSGGALRNMSLIGTGGGASTSLNNLSGVSINADLDPSGSSRDLGSSSSQWRNLYINGTAYLDAIGFGNYSMELPTTRGSNGEVLTTNGSNALSWTSVSGGSSGADTALSNLSNVSINADLIPQSNKSLGSSSSKWKNLYIWGTASLDYINMGGNIDCNNNHITDIGDLGNTSNKVNNLSISSIWQYGQHNLYNGASQYHQYGSAVSFDGLIQFGSNVTQADTSVPSSSSGKIQIQVGGYTKYIYYYSS